MNLPISLDGAIRNAGMLTPAQQAYQDLLASGEVDEVTELEPEGALGDVSFFCMLPIPWPNAEGLPDRIRMHVHIPGKFPRSNVEFLPQGEIVRGFAHQNGVTGAICVRPGEYPSSASERLIVYVRSAKQWLFDAAHGTLLKAGQHWELPYFWVDRSDKPPNVLTLEDAESFTIWQQHICKSGDVQFVAHSHDRGIVPSRFSIGSEEILRPTIGKGFVDNTRSCLGSWFLLPSLVIERHRPARTFRELEDQCSQCGIDVWPIIRRAVKHPDYRGFHFVLVGAPIPDKVGGSPTRIHWQPIAIPVAKVDRLTGPRRGFRPKPGDANPNTLQRRIALEWRNDAIPWSSVVSYPPESAERRGSLDESLKAARICIVGTGALGAPLADHLVRGSVRDLALFDREPLELENLVRHPLGPPEVGSGKAAALAHRLNGIHPRGHVRGRQYEFPPNAVRTRADVEVLGDLARSDVIINCTANRDAFLWLSAFAREHDMLMVHVYTNAHATMLTLCVSGRHVACERVAVQLNQDIRDGRTPFTPEQHSPDIEELFPAIGCWHATFPALGGHIATLVASAIPVVESLVKQRRRSAGVAIVLRRKEFDLDLDQPLAGPSSLVEIAWSQSYR
ncbi:MAG: ThiF family adenylyltransferase [Myxococcales bacterium]